MLSRKYGQFFFFRVMPLVSGKRVENAEVLQSPSTKSVMCNVADEFSAAGDVSGTVDKAP